MKYILDVGSGDFPFPQANLFIDRYIFNNNRRFGGLVLKENFIIADAHHLPLKCKSIDRVYSSGMIEYLEFPNKFIEECNRVSDCVMIKSPGAFNYIYGRTFSQSYGMYLKSIWNPIKKEWMGTHLICLPFLKVPRRLKMILFDYSIKKLVYFVLTKLGYGEYHYVKGCA